MSCLFRRRWVFVTGMPGDIALSSERILREHGYSTILVSHPRKDKITLTKPILDGESIQMVCDLSSETDIQSAVAALQEKGITSLAGAFLAAGGGAFVPMSEITWTKLDRLTKDNFYSTVLSIRMLAPLIDAGGCIVLCGSALSNLGIATSSVYAATKAAIESLTKSFARELGPRVRVNCVAPGAIRTGTYRKHGLDIDKIEERVCQSVPAKRMGTPDEVGAVVDFLLSPAAAYVSGAVVEIHGGGLPNII